MDDLVQVKLKYNNVTNVVWVINKKEIKKNSIVRLKNDNRDWIIEEVYSGIIINNINTDWEVGGLGKRSKKPVSSNIMY